MTLALDPGNSEPEDPINVSCWQVVVTSGDASVIPRKTLGFCATAQTDALMLTVALPNPPLRVSSH